KPASTNAMSKPIWATPTSALLCCVESCVNPTSYSKRNQGQLGCHEAVSHLVNLLGDETLNALAREALVALKVDPDFF
ncbi:MAG: hypothetical protein AAFV93_15905, partial [Chloroflexota bacterium]